MQSLNTKYLYSNHKNVFFVQKENMYVPEQIKMIFSCDEE